MLGTFCKHQSYANPSMWEGFDCRVFPWLQGVSGQPFRLGSAVPKWLQEVGKAIVEEESRFHALSSMCSWPMMSNRRHHDEVFGDGCVLWFMFIYIYNIAQETLAPAFARGGGERGAAMAARSTSNAAGSRASRTDRVFRFCGPHVYMHWSPSSNKNGVAFKWVKSAAKNKIIASDMCLRSADDQHEIWDVFAIWKIRSSSEKVQKLL